MLDDPFKQLEAELDEMSKLRKEREAWGPHTQPVQRDRDRAWATRMLSEYAGITLDQAQDSLFGDLFPF